MNNFKVGDEVVLLTENQGKPNLVHRVQDILNDKVKIMCQWFYCDEVRLAVGKELQTRIRHYE